MNVMIYDSRGRRISDWVPARDIVRRRDRREDGTIRLYPGLMVSFEGVRLWIEAVGGFIIDELGEEFVMIFVTNRLPLRKEKVYSLEPICQTGRK